MWTRSLRILSSSLAELELSLQRSLTNFSSSTSNRPPRNSNESGHFRRNNKFKQRGTETKNENFIRISSMNSRGGAYRKFRVGPSEIDKNDDYEAYRKGLSDFVDPDELHQSEKDLDLYSTSEQAYHSHVIQEDMRSRRRDKIAIIKKKVAKLEGHEEENLNLLTWDAKEQIKHLNIIDPGRLF